MAWKHIAAAFKYTENDLSETALHILLRIAWEMRDNDYAFPGTRYLAERIHVSRKTVQRAIKELTEAGAITVRSGRFCGHKSHYYLTFKGAPPVDNSMGGGTNPTSPSVDNMGGGGTNPTPTAPREVGQIRPQEGEVGQFRPAEVGQTELPLGQIPPEGWDKNALGEKRIRQDNNTQVSLSQLVRNVPPPTFDDGLKQKIPPVGTIEFKSFAIRFCLDAGATLEEAHKFYEHNQAEGWKVLGPGGLPLEIAALQWVNKWHERDPRGWTNHQLAEAMKRERHQCTC